MARPQSWEVVGHWTRPAVAPRRTAHPMQRDQPLSGPLPACRPSSIEQVIRLGGAVGKQGPSPLCRGAAKWWISAEHRNAEQGRAS